MMSNFKFHVAALRNVEKHLGLEKLYVLGTNCGKLHKAYPDNVMPFYVAFRVGALTFLETTFKCFPLFFLSFLCLRWSD